MTMIKFCGMTRGQDVATAVELGVDAVGFVLWPGSPRHITLERAAEIIATMPAAVTTVGVFVRPSRDDIARAVDAGIRVAQIHAGDTAAASHSNCEVWIAASLKDDDVTPPVDSEQTVLLDAHDPERHGGTGRTIDWTRAAHVAARRRVMLAGGLTPANVAAAVRDVRPFGVDVASGIEDTPGIKNALAMQAFVAAVREADQQ
jgi:phosphoribosylanthranilate isomerase